MIFLRLAITRHKIAVLLLLILLISSGPSAAAQHASLDHSACDTLVVCPPEFQPSLRDWIEYRQRQGHSIAVVAPARDPESIRNQIHQIAENGKLKFVFLIGDATSDPPNGPVIPMHRVAAKVNVLFGSEPQIATDNRYADLDHDGVPDLAIGRLPADTAQEVTDFLRRSIDYEKNEFPDQHWRRKINFVAGVGGFGGVIDNVIENTTKQIITDLIPQHYQTSMTFGSWRSPYCPDPRRFSQTAIERFNDGCLFWIYIGHGQRTRLDRVHFPDQSYPILDQHSVQNVACTQGSPIAIFLSCYTGSVDHDQDCLAETLLRQPHGPVAAICGTRVTMPYAMSLLSLELIDEYFNGNVITLGQLAQVAKRRLMRRDHENADEKTLPPNRYREMVLGMGKLLSPQPDLLSAECLEHVQMIHVLGDPLLRLKRPEPFSVSVPRSAPPGSTVTVTGVAPAEGELCVELVYRRDRFRHRPPHRSEFISTHAEFEKYQTTYYDSQNLTCASNHQRIAAGPFQVSLQLPTDATGRCSVRCMLNSAEHFALGSAPIRVVTQTAHRPPAPKKKTVTVHRK